MLKSRMRPKLHIVRNLAAALVLAALSLAPSAASAHAGHQHPQAAATQQNQPAAQTPAGHRTVAPAAVIDAEAMTAKTLPAIPSSDLGCDGCACCSNGPCTGCHGAVLVFSLVPIPPLLSVMLAGGDAPSRASPHDGRLRRPPKSFA